jgi:hypothetical protein
MPLDDKSFRQQCLHAAPACVPVLPKTLFCFTFIWAAQKRTQLLNNAPKIAGAIYNSIFTANRT